MNLHILVGIHFISCLVPFSFYSGQLMSTSFYLYMVGSNGMDTYFLLKILRSEKHFAVDGHKLVRIMPYCMECVLLIARDYVNKFAFAWIGCWSRFQAA